ncbi:lysine--tRNA ligase [Bacteriovoracaceae bacterium]|nr:lysine--tRNA ligase [Bacteriovoracaceae bacterium]
MSREKFTQPWTSQYSDQIESRLQKRDKLIEMGRNPYRNDLKADTKAKDLVNQYSHLAKEDIGETPVFEMIGRVLLVRDFGKAAFLQIDDSTSRFQIYVKKKVTVDECFEEYKLLDYGDIVYAKGTLFKTNKGELTLEATHFHIVSKSIRPLPEKFHGLTDAELKYRMRYVDMIMNDETRKKLKTRSEIVRFIREYFYENEYLEVETPMMHSVAGGATAKPFMSHHNALDMELFMRIAPELHLKRLIVGGYHRVFEMNRCFRNEGLSVKHNPEFTSIEFYQAYATYLDLMVLTEDLLSKLVLKVHKNESVIYGDRTISFAAPFKRLTLKQSVINHTHLDESDIGNKEALIKLLVDKDFKKVDLEKNSINKLMVLVFEEYVEDQLIQPTFITQYPTEVSPLSRASDKDPDFVDRFELFINGWEIANAFSELNDPTDQLNRFAGQAMLKEDGDEEACEVDYDYVRALEYGMPPTAGEGIGIDRLVMILTNSTTIRDVILFPLLKKEHFFHENGSGDESEVDPN